MLNNDTPEIVYAPGTNVVCHSVLPTLVLFYMMMTWYNVLEIEKIFST